MSANHQYKLKPASVNVTGDNTSSDTKKVLHQSKSSHLTADRLIHQSGLIYFNLIRYHISLVMNIKLILRYWYYV